MKTSFSQRADAAIAIRQKIDEWLKTANTSMKELQDVFYKQTGLSTQLSQIKRTNNEYGAKTHNEVRDFLNDYCIGLPDITADWKYGLETAKKVFYTFYYAKENSVQKSIVEILMTGDVWTGFTLRHYRQSAGKNVISSIYSGDSAAISYGSESIFCLLTKDGNKNTTQGNRHYHAYTFSAKRNSLNLPQYIFGTYSRKKPIGEIPVAGICLLERCDVDNLEKATEQLSQPVHPSIYNILYGRRIEVRESEAKHNLVKLPNFNALKHLLEYSGTWEACHLDSDLHNGKGFLRTFSIDLESNGHATIEYSDQENSDRIEKVEGFFTCLDVTLLYGEFQWDNDNSVSRLIFCLTPGEEGTMTGVYGGYSARNKKPYAGAVALVKKEIPEVRNISKEKQTISDLPLVRSLRKAYLNHINLPELSLNEQLNAHFNESIGQVDDITGDYLAYSLSSTKQAIVCYPLSFKNGVCTLTGKTHQFTSSIHRDGESFVWVEFDTRSRSNRPWKSILAISQKGKDFSNFECFSGISLRENREGKVQAKRELIVKSRVAEQNTFRSFPFGSDEFKELLEDLPGLRNFLGREYSILEIVKSHQLNDLVKREEFDQMYLLYAVKCFLDGKEKDWKHYLKQAMLHGLFLGAPVAVAIQELLKSFPINDAESLVSAFERECSIIEAEWKSRWRE